MASTVSPTYPANGGANDVTPVNANFAALAAWINDEAMPLDAAKAFTAIPTAIAGTPTGQQLVTKSHGDSYYTTPAAAAAAAAALHPLTTAFTGVNPTPALTVTQGATVSHAANYAKEIIVGKQMHVRFRLTMSTSGTASNIIQIEGLQAATNAYSIGGYWRCYDASSTTSYAGTIWGASTTVVKLLRDGTTNSFGLDAAAVTLASGDILEGDIFYELP